jgi:hypothetical protein
MLKLGHQKTVKNDYVDHAKMHNEKQVERDKNNALHETQE